MFVCCPYSPLLLQQMHKSRLPFRPIVRGQLRGQTSCHNGAFDWETGSSYEWNRRNGAHEHTWTINTSLFRLGLTTNVELRFQLDESATLASQKLYGGISNASVGTKIKVFEGSKGLPKTAFLGTILLPGSSQSHYLPKHIGVQSHLLFENNITEFFSIGYDIGVEWNGETHRPDIFFGAGLNFQPTDRWCFFIESYNRFNSEKQEDWASPGHRSHFNCMGETGVSYIVTPRLQLNMYSDICFNEPFKYVNLGVGMAWLLH